jgi:hypothetical protein
MPALRQPAVLQEPEVDGVRVGVRDDRWGVACFSSGAAFAGVGALWGNANGGRGVILHVLLVAVLTWLAVGSAIAGVILGCLCWSVIRGWVDDRDRVRRIRQCVLLADVDAHDDALVRTLAEIQSLPIANS